MKSLNQLTTIFFSALFSLATLLSAQAHAEGDLYFIHSDHLGTPQAMTDSAQNVVWKTQQTPFGETVEETSSVVQPLRFPGQYADPESGLSYNYFRDYDPSLGRYVQSDPIGLQGGLNTYGYVGGRPLIFIDPPGLQAIFNKDGVTFHAYHKGDGSNETAKQGPHGDYHVHINGGKKKVVVIKKDGNGNVTLIPENPESLTNKEKAVLNNLTGNEMKYLRKACTETFHNNGTDKVLKKLFKKYVGSIAGGAASTAILRNTHTEACSMDYLNQIPFCD
ncbi:RHS repeat domain-containing protein [Hahella sp. NBU794]|uniref:RHS repeat domain-containing protein n=1 Tax=Hahella sp. NBU794 TaxID=3422590 RepID=UPI003D6E38AB